MNPVILFWSIPILAVVACFLSFYANKMYLTVYERYISFEPAALFKTTFSHQSASFLIFTIAFCISPAFLLFQGHGHSSEFIFLCGFAITFFASFITRSLGCIFVYNYIQKHPNLINGQTIFKNAVFQIIIASIYLQQFLLLTILAFYMPCNPFFIGAIFALGLMGIGHYFSKYRTATY